MEMFAWHCKYHPPLGGALYIRGLGIPERGVNSLGRSEVFDAGLWPALRSFSCLLAGDLLMKFVTSPSAGQYPNYDGPSSLSPSLSLCARCRVIPDFSPEWFVSSLRSKEYWNARVLAFKFFAKCTFSKYKTTCPLDRQCRVRLPILCQRSQLIGSK